MVGEGILFGGYARSRGAQSATSRSIAGLLWSLTLQAACEDTLTSPIRFAFTCAGSETRSPALIFFDYVRVGLKNATLRDDLSPTRPGSEKINSM